MARIRSIHPGIWTDEDFAVLSMAARVLYFGILTECDDHGIFEWKPIGLKMRIFPADKVDVEPLISELIGANKVSQMEPDQDKYLGVRNFCKYQRPKKPTYRFPFKPEWGSYVGLTDDSSVPVPHQFGTGTEIPPQMKEEGGNRRRKEDSADAAPPSNSRYAFESGIIRLSKKHFDQWRENFSHLDLGAELIALTPWADQAGPERWFHAVANALAKRNREVKSGKDNAKNGPEFKWKSGIEGVV